MQRYEHRLARGLAAILNLLDPDVVILGGGLSNLERLYVNVPRLWGAFVFSDVVTTPLVKNRHGDSSGVRGAAWLWSPGTPRSEEHTSELQSLMRLSYAVFCLKKNKKRQI